MHCDNCSQLEAENSRLLRELEGKQDLEQELARLKRNYKCYGCGHSNENHGSEGCLVWVMADAERKCLCKAFIDVGKS